LDPFKLKFEVPFLIYASLNKKKYTKKFENKRKRIILKVGSPIPELEMGFKKY